jgi:hypothetical protein
LDFLFRRLITVGNITCELKITVDLGLHFHSNLVSKPEPFHTWIKQRDNGHNLSVSLPLAISDTWVTERIIGEKLS